MSAGGRDWELVLGRLSRARIKARLGFEGLERAENELVTGERDAVLYETCKQATLDLDMAVALLKELTLGLLDCGLESPDRHWTRQGERNDE